MRREPGLFRALDVCVELIDRNLLSGEDLRRVLEGLEELLIETDYQGWRHGGFRAATLTYVRANAVRTIRALKRADRKEAIISEWIQAGADDPAPEVRYVTDSHD